jgi:hypothetical protein
MHRSKLWAMWERTLGGGEGFSIIASKAEIWTGTELRPVPAYNPLQFRVLGLEEYFVGQ